MRAFRKGNLIIEVEPYEERLDGRGFATVCSPHLSVARVFKEEENRPTLFVGKYIIGNTTADIENLLRVVQEV